MILFSRHMPKVYAKRPLLILDESHSLESFLYEYASVSVTLKKLSPLRPFTGDVLDRLRDSFGSVDEFMDFTKEVILPAFKKYESVALEEEEEEGDDDSLDIDEDDQKNADKVLKKLIKSLNDFLAEEVTDRSHVLIPEKELDIKEEVIVGWKIKPFSVAGLSHLAFGSSDSRVLLMSATILDPTTFCKSLGISKDEVFFIRVPSTFPADNRLIVGDLSVGSMSYKCKDETLPKMLDKILELTEKHDSHKGIIHTGNYENMHKFKRWVATADRTLHDRLLFQSKGTFEEKEMLIRMHQESDIPTILCGPSFIEGIDLKDDLARFNIIMKLPYLSLADPLVKRKAEEYPEWYALQVALALIQAIGRPVRSPTDWAVTYILDLLWKFFYEKERDRLFPKHIQDAVRWVSSRYPVPYA